VRGSRAAAAAWVKAMVSSSSARPVLRLSAVRCSTPESRLSLATASSWTRMSAVLRKAESIFSGETFMVYSLR